MEKSENKDSGNIGIEFDEKDYFRDTFQTTYSLLDEMGDNLKKLNDKLDEVFK